MKLRIDFTVQKLAESFCIIPSSVSDDFIGYIRTNETGLFLINLLREEITEEEMIDKIMNHYGISRADAEPEVIHTIKTLRENGLLLV